MLGYIPTETCVYMHECSGISLNELTCLLLIVIACSMNH